MLEPVLRSSESLNLLRDLSEVSSHESGLEENHATYWTFLALGTIEISHFYIGFLLCFLLSFLTLLPI